MRDRIQLARVHEIFNNFSDAETYLKSVALYLKDGEGLLARYTENNTIKTALGVCYNDYKATNSKRYVTVFTGDLTSAISQIVQQQLAEADVYTAGENVYFTESEDGYYINAIDTKYRFHEGEDGNIYLQYTTVINPSEEDWHNTEESIPVSNNDFTLKKEEDGTINLYKKEGDTWVRVEGSTTINQVTYTGSDTIEISEDNSIHVKKNATGGLLSAGLHSQYIAPKFNMNHPCEPGNYTRILGARSNNIQKIAFTFEIIGRELVGIQYWAKYKFEGRSGQYNLYCVEADGSVRSDDYFKYLEDLYWTYHNGIVSVYRKCRNSESDDIFIVNTLTENHYGTSWKRDGTNESAVTREDIYNNGSTASTGYSIQYWITSSSVLNPDFEKVADSQAYWQYDNNIPEAAITTAEGQLHQVQKAPIRLDDSGTSNIGDGLITIYQDGNEIGHFRVNDQGPTDINLDLTSFITASVSNLVNYYTKEDTYNKTEVYNKGEIETIQQGLETSIENLEDTVSHITTFRIEIVNVLPVEGEAKVLYLVPKTDPEIGDFYEEYVWITSQERYEKIGSTRIDLTNYYTKNETDSVIHNYVKNAKLTINFNNSLAGEFTANQDQPIIVDLNETDPVFNASVAKTITQQDVTNWNNAQENVIEDVKVNGTSLTITNKSVDVPVPTDTSQLTNSAGFITINDVPAQVQSDWNQSDSTATDYIQNKPINLSDFNNDIVNDNTITIKTNGTTVDSFTTNNQSSKDIDIPLPTNLSDLNNDLVNDNTITIKTNGTTVDSFTTNNSSSKDIDIPLPTNLSDLNNDLVNDNTITIKTNGTTVDSFTTNNSSSKDIDIPLPTNLTDLNNDLVNDNTITIQTNGSTVDSFTTNAQQSKTINIPIPSNLTDLNNDLVNDNTITIQTNGSTVDSFTTNASQGKTINIPVPANLTDLNNDLVNDNTITIQTNGSTVDSFTTNASQGKTINIPVPTNTSDLNNDSGFITNTVNDLVNYYKKSETYTQAEINALIGAIQGFSYEIYPSTSSVVNPQSNVLYLIGPNTSVQGDQYEEYVYTNNTWTKIGDTSIDLSGYARTTDIGTATITINQPDWTDSFNVNTNQATNINISRSSYCPHRTQTGTLSGSNVVLSKPMLDDLTTIIIANVNPHDIITINNKDIKIGGGVTTLTSSNSPFYDGNVEEVRITISKGFITNSPQNYYNLVHWSYTQAVSSCSCESQCQVSWQYWDNTMTTNYAQFAQTDDSAQAEYLRKSTPVAVLSLLEQAQNTQPGQ